MACAHVPALVAVARLHPTVLDGQSQTVLSTLVMAASCGPAALATHADLAALLSQAARAVRRTASHCIGC